MASMFNWMIGRTSLSGIYVEAAVSPTDERIAPSSLVSAQTSQAVPMTSVSYTIYSMPACQYLEAFVNPNRISCLLSVANFSWVMKQRRGLTLFSNSQRQSWSR